MKGMKRMKELLESMEHGAQTSEAECFMFFMRLMVVAPIGRRIRLF